MMNVFITCLAACLLHMLHSAPTSISWCYHKASCSDIVWPIIAEKDCNGTQQSPIDIVTTNVQANTNLTHFTFTGYNENSTLTEITNTGTTIQVTLDHKKMHVEGGDLPGLFASTQFHFHWGSGSATPGSEHSVNGKQYPMELHILNKAEHNGSVPSDSILAAFGIFIEASNDTGKPESWKILTSYLTEIASAGDKTRVFDNLTMDDLLSGVDRTKYYRYLGSLTTPNCDEGVIWTIFKDPIKVSRDLIDLFTTTVYINKTSNSPLMTNTFRGVQPVNGRIVMSQIAGTKITGLIMPTSATKTTATIKPTSATKTTAILKPTSATKTTAILKPTSATKTTAVLKPTSATKTTATIKPTSATKTTAILKPTSATKTTAIIKPTSATKTTAILKPTSATKTTAILKPTSATKTTAILKPTSATKTTAIIKPTSATKTTATIKPTSATKTTSIIKPTSATETTGLKPKFSLKTTRPLKPASTATNLSQAYIFPLLSVIMLYGVLSL
ncbi:carbonic anhydrase 4-like [Carassius carassius]|uniref:carbonic anhydrase 4-like n=1 Tax=Carassius carassius TaxID=217509 RepID=UPI002869220C|nr:carbonic anhydrase 4-like [Carassius carassius]